MATALLSRPRSRLHSLSSVRPLIPQPGSILLAAHAYHKQPTSALQKRLLQNDNKQTRSEFVGCAYILRTASSLMRAAVLRDISAGTSYQTVRLVFRPYTHVLPSS